MQNVHNKQEIIWLASYFSNRYGWTIGRNIDVNLPHNVTADEAHQARHRSIPNHGFWV